MQRLRRTLISLSAATALAALTAPGVGAEKQHAAPAHKMINAADLKWGPAPPGLPAAVQATVLDGDPTKPGLFTVRLKAPDGTQIMPHWHPADEHVTVLSGALMVGMGQKWDDAAMRATGHRRTRPHAGQAEPLRPDEGGNRSPADRDGPVRDYLRRPQRRSSQEIETRARADVRRATCCHVRTCGRARADVRQYFDWDGSTRSIHARMPPARL